MGREGGSGLCNQWYNFIGNIVKAPRDGTGWVLPAWATIFSGAGPEIDFSELFDFASMRRALLPHGIHIVSRREASRACLQPVAQRPLDGWAEYQRHKFTRLDDDALKGLVASESLRGYINQF